MVWATREAPVLDCQERVVLNIFAEEAKDDGTDAFPSLVTVAERALLDKQTVRNRVQHMVQRGLMRLGNQNAARYIDARYRPKVYDLCIPYSFWSSRGLDRINRYRARLGRAPITAETHPELSSAATAPRRKRADAGKPKPPPAQAGQSRTDTEPALAEEDVIHTPARTQDRLDRGKYLEDTPGLKGYVSHTPSQDPAEPGQGYVRGMYDPRPGVSTYIPDPVLDPPDPPPPTPEPEPAATAAGKPERGGKDRELHTTTPGEPDGSPAFTALVAELCSRQPEWPPGLVKTVLVEAAKQGWPPGTVAAAARSIAAGEHGPTRSPRRLLERGPWWAAAPPTPQRVEPAPHDFVDGPHGTCNECHRTENARTVVDGLPVRLHPPQSKSAPRRCQHDLVLVLCPECQPAGFRPVPRPRRRDDDPLKVGAQPSRPGLAALDEAVAKMQASLAVRDSGGDDGGEDVPMEGVSAFTLADAAAGLHEGKP